MPRTRDRLTTVEVNSARLEPSQRRRYLVDGGGLYLMITRLTGISPNATKGKPSDLFTKSWVFRYRSRVTGKGVELGLGSLLDVPLALAREKAAELREVIAKKKDPKGELERERQALKIEAAKVMTFDQAAEHCIKDKKGGWKNEKHKDQWKNTLATYASPIIGSLPVSSVDLALVRKVLDPIWGTKSETAVRVRQRIESVLAWATVSGYRTGDNPARWKNHLDHLLPSPAKVKPKKNHPALHYGRVGAFLVALESQDGVAADALEFTILTAARTNEVLGMVVDELELDRGLWTIPPERMKAKKEHTVPLSPRAVEVLRRLPKRKSGQFVFSETGKEPLSEGAMLALLKRMDAKTAEGWKDAKGNRIVPHGFRSTFRDWAGECSNFPREVIENALAHQLKDKAEAAYARGTQLAKRKALMDAWASYCSKVNEPPQENVIPIRAEVG